MRWAGCDTSQTWKVLKGGPPHPVTLPLTPYLTFHTSPPLPHLPLPHLPYLTSLTSPSIPHLPYLTSLTSPPLPHLAPYLTSHLTYPPLTLPTHPSPRLPPLRTHSPRRSDSSDPSAADPLSATPATPHGSEPWDRRCPLPCHPCCTCHRGRSGARRESAATG